MKRRVAGWIGLCLVWGGLAGGAQGPELERMLASPDFRVREEGFSRLLQAEDGPGLIRLLERENRVALEGVRQRRAGRQRLPGAFYEYWATLMQAVARLDTPAVIPVLLPSLGSGGGVRRALAEQGEPALEAMFALLAGRGLAELEEGPYGPGVRGECWAVLATMVEPQTRPIPAAARARIRRLFLGFAAEPDEIARLWAIRGLGWLGDQESLGALRRYLASRPKEAELRREAEQSLAEAARRQAKPQQESERFVWPPL